MKTSALLSVLLPASAVVAVTGPAPSPQPGSDSNCKVFHKVKEGETCKSIVDDHWPIDARSFYNWNLGVGKYCQNFQPGDWVCVCKSLPESAR